MTMRMSVPIEERTSTRRGSVGQSMQGWTRLFLIELKRSPAVWAAIAIALITWWLMRGGLRVGVVYWQTISHVASDPMMPISGVAAGVAAFVSSRDRRSQTGEQIHTTAVGRMSRDLAVALPVLIWCLLGYASVVAGYFVYAANRATWGGPEWSYVLIPIASIVASVPLGWLVGSLFHNRLAPLVALGLAISLHAVYPLTEQFRIVNEALPNGVMVHRYGVGWWRMLVPLEILDFSPVFGVIALGILWLLGLALLYWCVSGWLRYRSGAAGAGVAMALVLTFGSASALVSGGWEIPRTAYVEPVCTTRFSDQILVCVHPKGSALLDESADAIADVLTPLQGISGLPTQYVEMQGERVGDENVYFSLYDRTTITNLALQQAVLSEVLHGPSGFSGRIGSAQYVIGSWLLQEAGIDPEKVGFGQLLMPLRTVYSTDADIRAGITDPMSWGRQGPSPEEFAAFEQNIHASIDRFAALSPEEQQAWLEINWDALRAGELTLEDLP